MRLLLALFLAAASVCPAGDLYRIWLDGEDEAYDRVTEGYRTVLSLRGQFVDALLEPAEAQAIAKDGLRVEFVQKDPEELMRRIAADPLRGEYRSYSEMCGELRELERAHPDLVRLRDFGDGWEKTAGIASRDLWAVGVFSAEAERKRAPAVLLLGGVHAREIATTEVLTDFIQRLVRDYRSEPAMKSLLDSRRIWVVPLLNPDGREHVLATDPWWRKNRHRFADAGAVGVDLNRNFPFFWSTGVGASDSPSSAIYRGEAPLSEPETAAFCSLITELAPVASLAFHAYGGYILTPYGYPGKQPEERAVYQAMRTALSELTGYPAGTVGDLLGYFSSGRHDDWLYGNRRVVSLEIELGRTFFPVGPDLRALSKMAGEACLQMARLAGDWLEGSLELQQRARPRRSGEFVSGRELRAHLMLANRGLTDARDLKWQLTALTPGVTVDPDSGRVERLGGLRGLKGPARVALHVRAPTPATAAGDLAFELAIETSTGRQTQPLTLRLGPVPGE